MITELLSADDCTLVAHIIYHLQEMMDSFSNVAKNFSLQVIIACYTSSYACRWQLTERRDKV